MQSDLKALEFSVIQRLLENASVTPYGKDAARELEPAPELALAQRMQDAVTAAREALDRNDPPPLPEDVPDIRPALRQARTPGAALNPRALANIRQTLGIAMDLQEAVRSRPPLLPAGMGRLDVPAELVEALDRTVTGVGKLRDDASETLTAKRQELERLQSEAADAIRQRTRKRDIRDAVNESEALAWHGQRAVLQIHQKASEKVKGVRRGSAMGGRDQLIEPVEAVQTNNRIESVSGEIHTEEQRILREVTGVVREHQEAVESVISALTWIDLALAGGKFSAAVNAHPPKLVTECQVSLDQAYHPLLLLQFAEGKAPQPVPVSLALGPEESMMLITGPNTGGKTVALKTLGLIVTMAHCGLHVPAEGDCTVGAYERVMVDVGDRQSLYHHLSTFAGHVEVLKRILDEADARSLVLLDELGTGTDPEEGAALAMAVLDELLDRGVQGIVNSHLSPLKGFAEQRNKLTNASVRFDREALAPTYELEVGVPGRSLGLLVAERNGLPAELVQRARGHLEQIAPDHQTLDEH